MREFSNVLSLISVISTFQVRNGHIKRITDNDIQSLVLEVVGTNVRYEFYLQNDSKVVETLSSIGIKISSELGGNFIVSLSVKKKIIICSFLFIFWK